MKSIEKSGKTVEDAIKAGLRELGCDYADVTTEVLDMGSPGLFGMFGRLAKVRLTEKDVEEEKLDLASLTAAALEPAKPATKPAPVPKVEAAPKAEAERPVKPAPAPKAEAERSAKPAPAPKDEAERSAKPAPKAEFERSVKPAPRPEREAPSLASEPSRPAPRPRTERPAAPRTARPPRPVPAPIEELPEETSAPVPFEPIPFVEKDKLGEAGQLAYEFLETVTRQMGAPVALHVREDEEGLLVQMIGDERGILIGRRGETLDALQYLTSLQVNKHREPYVRVTLDAENYRAKREDALKKLAARMAMRARKTGRRVTLEPMNPYERRVLHSALQNNPYVETHSEGEDPYRRVIITLK